MSKFNPHNLSEFWKAKNTPHWKRNPHQKRRTKEVKLILKNTKLHKQCSNYGFTNNPNSFNYRINEEHLTVWMYNIINENPKKYKKLRIKRTYVRIHLSALDSLNLSDTEFKINKIDY